MPTAPQHPTPNIPSSSATLYITSTTRISAPLETVWSALTDISTYPSWNHFIPRVTIRSQPNATATSPHLRQGTKFTFHANMYPERHEDPQPDKRGLNETFLEVIEYSPPPPPPPESGSGPSMADESGEGGRKGRIVWASDSGAGGLISWFLTAERVHEVEEVVENGSVVVEVRNWESQVGVLAYVVRWLFEGRLNDNFGYWERGLKRYSESSTRE
ncbi:uncharacterized protein BDV14DRAFT_181872 [Aspergillus stella-maris]|uniref:uncharacterized protein n=1 Tax=Aspergillus stella-maris TaxID=1810926 RepID=UPI003CCD1BD7